MRSRKIKQKNSRYIKFCQSRKRQVERVMKTSYRTNLTDEQWKIIKPLISEAKSGGRPRTVDMREVINGIFYSE